MRAMMTLASVAAPDPPPKERPVTKVTDDHVLQLRLRCLI